MFKDKDGVWKTEDFSTNTSGEYKSLGIREATKEEIVSEEKRIEKINKLLDELDEKDRIENENKKLLNERTV